MGLDTGSWRIGSRGARLGLIALLALAVNAGAAGPDETTKLDCGVNALFVLLRLEGRPVTLDRLESSLPPRRPDGYSMAELATAARSLGLGLEGVRFIKGDKALTRPAIAFLKDAKGGHFAVLRPVGTTGTMVQVIDPPQAPWIADYDRLLAARPWTGRILVPSDPWIVRHPAILIASISGLLLVATALRHRVRKMVAHEPDERRPPDLSYRYPLRESSAGSGSPLPSPGG
jgi:hypothetical protein